MLAFRVRVAWVLATLLSAAFPGVIVYLALWFLLPEGPPAGESSGGQGPLRTG